MDYGPLIAYVVVLLIYRVSEGSAVVHVGSWNKRPKWEWTLPSVVGMFVLILIAPPLEYVYHGAHPGLLTYLIGGLCFVLAVLFRVKGHLDLKKGFSMSVEKVEGQQLVDTGLYKHIRHPLYLGSLSLFLACPTFLGAWRSLILSLLGTIAIYFRIRKEEAFLTDNMPGYKEYMKRTWALIPRIY